MGFSSPYKDNLMGEKCPRIWGKTIKSVENKYLWSTFLVEVLVCLDEADRQKIKPLEMSDVRQLTPAACILVTLPYRSATVWSATKVVLYCRKSKCFPFICAFTKHSLTSHLCSMVIYTSTLKGVGVRGQAPLTPVSRLSPAVIDCHKMLTYGSNKYSCTSSEAGERDSQL